MLRINIQSFSDHAAELNALVQLRKIPPAMVCLNETWLDKSTEQVELNGYKLTGRRDRQDGQDDRKRGGVMVFSRDDIASSVTLLENSEHAERMWLVVHTDQGPYLLCIWYRPPEPGEIQTISTFENEWLNHCGSALGTIIMGDLNLHHIGWL